MAWVPNPDAGTYAMGVVRLIGWGLPDLRPMGWQGGLNPAWGGTYGGNGGLRFRHAGVLWQPWPADQGARIWEDARYYMMRSETAIYPLEDIVPAPPPSPYTGRPRENLAYTFLYPAQWHGDHPVYGPYGGAASIVPGTEFEVLLADEALPGSYLPAGARAVAIGSEVTGGFVSSPSYSASLRIDELPFRDGTQELMWVPDPPRSLLGATQVADNAIRLEVADDVLRSNRGDVADALHDRAYTLELVSEPPGAVRVPRVVWAEAEGDGVRLSLDAPLAGPGVTYRVRGSTAVYAPAMHAALVRTFGPQAAPGRTQHARSYDLANVAPLDPNTGEQGLGTLAVGADGDLATDHGLESLKKRILRRVSTPIGAYRHLPDYGLRLPLKARFGPTLMRDLQAQAIRQIRAEPGVLEARVGVSRPGPGVVRLELAVETRLGSFADGIDVDLPAS